MKFQSLYDSIWCSCDKERSDQYQALQSGGYINAGKEVAVIRLNKTFGQYLTTGASKTQRYWKWHSQGIAVSNQLTVKAIDPVDHVVAIHEINTSMPVRSGGPMRENYLKSPTQLKVEFLDIQHTGCPFHTSAFYGCFDENDLLIGYLRLVRIGTLLLYARFLAHGDHLHKGPMFKMHCHAYCVAFDHVPDGLIMYGAWNSGGEGLQFWKKRCGFEPQTLEEE